MRTIIHILAKELKQMRRDPRVVGMSIMMPIVQMLFLVYAATFDIKNINLTVVDCDLSQTSRLLTQKFIGSPFFIVHSATDLQSAQELMDRGKTDMIMFIPKGFEQNLFRYKKAQLNLIYDAVNQTKASIANGYSQNIIQQFNQNIITRYARYILREKPRLPRKIDIVYRFWYNPRMDYKSFMVPGILAILITTIGMFLTAMNIVKEKEIGTIEQINVSPVKKYQFILGKLIPYWLLAIFDLSFGLLLGKLLFDIPIVGSLLTLFLAAGIYIFLALTFGLFLSTVSNTQQQALFLAWFFLIVFILMSGLFTAIESMPQWAQLLDFLNPMAYFVRIIRMVLLKGSTLTDISRDVLSMLVYGIIMFALSIKMYRKRA